MPNRSIRARWALILVAASAAFPASAGASRYADVRVIDKSGVTLAEQRQYTDTVAIRTDPGAACFGPGTGGSGDRVQVSGPTALGAVVDAGRFDSDVKPISVSDHFDFGLAICGFGGDSASGSSFWYLTHNHATSPTGGDLTVVGNGDDVVWWHDPDFSDAPPDELRLRAPATAPAGIPFTVRVAGFDGSGAETPAAGVTVDGGTAPAVTDAGGEATVTVGAGLSTLTATRAGDIPSNREVVCAGDACEPVGLSIGGSRRGDRIRGTRRGDEIAAGRGDDFVDLLRGGADDVNCGGGRDRVIIDAAGDDTIAANCEKVTTTA